MGFPFFVTTLKPTLVRKKIVKIWVLYFDRNFVSLGTASLEFAVTKTEKVRKVCEITPMLLEQSGDLFPDFRGKSANGPFVRSSMCYAVYYAVSYAVYYALCYAR